MIPLYDHQKKIIADDPKWKGLWQGTGSAKTRTSLELAQGKTLVIVLKTQRDEQKFENENKRFGINKDITVLSKEDFKKLHRTLPRFDTVIVDEAHKFFSGVHTKEVTRRGVKYPQTSQLFDALKWYLETHKPDRYYPLTATPASETKPLNVYAMATLFGAKWSYLDFRNKYYTERKKGFASIWFPKKTEELQQKRLEIIKRYGYTGSLSDYFDVPPQTHLVHYVSLTTSQKQAIKDHVTSEADPMARRAKQRAIENGILYTYETVKINEREEELRKKTLHFNNEKIEYILERAEEFDKMLVFANWKGQVYAIADALKQGGYNVYTITGETKNRKEILETIDNVDKCIVVVQSSISAGWEFKTCDCVIYASYSPAVVDKIQGDGRVLRADALKKNLYISLVVKEKGSMDEQAYKTINSGVDFNEKIYE
jgi:superfamily II DNA or RNA helicase